MKDYPYLYWPEMPSPNIIMDAIKALDYTKALDMLKFGTCVKECPTAADKYSEVDCYRTERMKNGEADFIGCTNQIGLAFLEEFGIDIEDYLGEDAAALANQGLANVKYPFRYDTK